MSLIIYSIAYPERLPDGTYQALLTAMPKAIGEAAGRYKRWQDAYGCLLGKHLLLAALRDEGWPVRLADLQYTGHGRPYLADGPDFNISHSGNRVACILGKEGRVGIDLEEIRDLVIDDFKDQFTDLEWASIRSASDPLTVFYHYWTAKEAVSKADGRGLNLPLADLKIDNDTDVLLEGRHWHIRQLAHFSNYACHIATEESGGDTVLKEWTPGEILAQF